MAHQQSFDDNYSQRLLLPPIHKKQQRQISLDKIMTEVKNKKRQLSQLSNENQPSNRYKFKYLHHYDNEEEPPADKKEAFEQEMLARGNISRVKQDMKDELQQPQMFQEAPLNNRNEIASRYRRCVTNPVTHIVSTPKKKEVISRSSSINSNQTDQYRTEPIRNPIFENGKGQHNMMTIVEKTTTKKSEQEDIVNEQQNLDAVRLKYQGEFKVEIKRLPKGKFSKTEEVLDPILKLLDKFNPFFRKIQRVIGVGLFRLNPILHRKPGQLIYAKGEHLNFFYVILCGRVKLSSKWGMRKVCESGETFGEEVMYGTSDLTLERAKSMNDCYLLAIGCRQLVRTLGELTRLGYRQGVSELQSMLRRNYILKGWVRSKFRLLNS